MQEWEGITITMMTIMYQTTKIPAYDGWNVRPAPGVFLFPIRELIKLYQNIVQKSLLHIHLSSRRSGLYREHGEAVKTLGWLEELWFTQYPEETNEQYLWSPDLQDLWAFRALLIFFTTLLCSYLSIM